MNAYPYPWDDDPADLLRDPDGSDELLEWLADTANDLTMEEM